jgi:isoquinoline 1-oxidoreductase subunit beta
MSGGDARSPQDRPRLLRPTRRELLLAGIAGAGALAVGVYGGMRLGQRAERNRRIVPPREQPFAPSAFVAIDERGDVTIWLGQAEVGQGVAAALPMALADELGADPSRVRVVLAPANEAYGPQFTAVSSSVRDHFVPMRTAGAAAREMLVLAAAAGFGAPAAECRAEDSAVVHVPTGRRLPFAALVHAAAKLPVPDAPQLKDPAQWTRIGKQMPRPDHRAKVDGSARFGADVRVPGMAFAVVQRCPTVGGRVATFDAAAARAVPGVLDVVAIGSGIAVLGATTHAAIQGRQRLAATFDRGPHVDWSSERVAAELRARDAAVARSAGAIARREGAGAAALQGPGTVVTADYELPYLAHATMEPMNCTADVRRDGCTIHAPTQTPQRVRDQAAAMLGLRRDQVVVQPTFCGGAFGRRVEFDFVQEAIEASHASGRPVQVFWTREDDFAHDFRRPCSRHHLEARLGGDGLPVAWRHRITAPSILRRDPGFTNAVDPVAVEGAAEMPYAVPAVEVEFVEAPALPFPIGFWRSVGHSYNAFAVECFVDEIAAAGGREPADVRRALLRGDQAQAHRAVLDLALARAGETPRSAAGERVGRGLAVHASFGSVVAMVADVRVAGTTLTVQRLTAAVDCGFAVHPDGVRAQIEGAVAFALTAMLHGDVTFADGAAIESNFHDQPLLTARSMPRVDVHFVERDIPPERLGGVGEIGVPPLAPAVANAVFAATGQRLRSLPLRLA